MTTEKAFPRCTLHGALGRAEQCPGADCPFWEQPEGHLLEVRATLEQARTPTR